MVPRHGHIEVRWVQLSQGEAANVLRHADHLKRLARRKWFGRVVILLGRIQRDALPDGILTRPQLPCRGLADNCHRDARPSLFIGERSSPDDRNAERFKIAGRDVAVMERGPLRVWFSRWPIERDRRAPHTAIEGRSTLADRFHSRHIAQTIHQLANDGTGLGCVVTQTGRYLDAHAQDLLGLESRIKSQGSSRSARQQPSGNQENHANAYLGGNQGVAHPRAAQLPSKDALFFQDCGQVGLRRLKRGRQPKQNSGQQRDDQGIAEHAEIRVNLEGERAPHSGKRIRDRCNQQAHRPPGKQQTDAARQHGKQRGLGQQLPDQSSTTCTKRQPHAYFLLPRRRPCQL